MYKMRSTYPLAVVALLCGDKACGFLPVLSNLHSGRTSYPAAMAQQEIQPSPGNFMDQLVQALDHQKTYLPNEAFWMTPSGSRGQGLLFDIKETPESFEVDIDVPGVKKEDITIDVKDRVLRISMERKGMVKEEDDTFRRIERFHGHMSRSLTLPSNVAKDAIAAECVNGVLHVKIPKTEGEKEVKVDIK